MRISNIFRQLHGIMKKWETESETTIQKNWLLSKFFIHLSKVSSRRQTNFLRTCLVRRGYSYLLTEMFFTYWYFRNHDGFYTIILAGRLYRVQCVDVCLFLSVFTWRSRMFVVNVVCSRCCQNISIINDIFWWAIRGQIGFQVKTLANSAICHHSFDKKLQRIRLMHGSILMKSSLLTS